MARSMWTCLLVVMSDGTENHYGGTKIECDAGCSAEMSCFVEEGCVNVEMALVSMWSFFIIKK